MNFINNIDNYKPKNEQEAQDKKVILECFKLFPDNILSRDNELAHITSSGFIVNQSVSKCLMIHHNIRNTWAWTGGHADGNDNLLEVAIEEAFEETGAKTIPLSKEIASIDILTVSGHYKNGNFINSHLHLSVAYILVANENKMLKVKLDENSAVEWFPIQKINKDFFKTSDIYLYTKLLQQAKDWIQGE